MRLISGFYFKDYEDEEWRTVNIGFNHVEIHVYRVYIGFISGFYFRDDEEWRTVHIGFNHVEIHVYRVLISETTRTKRGEPFILGLTMWKSMYIGF